MISREKADSLFKKFLEDGLPVFCIGTLNGVNVRLRGKIDLPANAVAIVTAEGEVTLRLDLDDEVFEFWDQRDLLPDAGSAMGLIVGLPLRFSPSQLTDALVGPVREKVCFIQDHGATQGANEE